VKYEGIYLFIQVILFKIINKDLENYSYQMTKSLKETLRKIALMDKEYFIISLDNNSMEYGDKIFYKKDNEYLDHFIIDLILKILINNLRL
jgi:hypothetical protein